MVLIYSVITGLDLALMLLFYLRSERYKDKVLKTEDALVQLAGKDDFFGKRNKLLRDDELAFYHQLKTIIGDEYYLFPQVHLSELVKVKNNVRDHENLYAIIGYKSVDYAVFSKSSMEPLLAIELNGASHLAYNRQNRDRVVESLLKHVGINLLQVNKNTYNVEDLKEKLKNLL